MPWWDDESSGYGQFQGIGEDPYSSRYRNMFQQNLDRGPQYDYSSYLDPDDPEVTKLRDAYSAPSGGSEILRSYLGRMPDRSEYNPSFGRRLMAFIGGTFSGANAGNRADQILNQPYNEDYKSWSDEGKFIDDQVRLLEADRNKEIQAIKLGIQEKGKALAAKNRGMTSSFNFAQRGTGQQLADQDRDASRLQREEEFRAREQRIAEEFRAREARMASEFATREGRLGQNRTKPEDPSEMLGDVNAAQDLAMQRARTQSMFAPIIDFYDKESQVSDNVDFKKFLALHPEQADLLRYFQKFIEDYSSQVINRGRRK